MPDLGGPDASPERAGPEAPEEQDVPVRPAVHEGSATALDVGRPDELAEGDVAAAGDGESPARRGRHPVPAGSTRRASVLSLITAIAAATLLTWAVTGGVGWLSEADSAVSLAVHDWAGALGWPLRVVTVVGEVTEPLWSALGAGVLVGVLASLRFRAAAGFLAGSVVLGLVLVSATKLLVGRQRPDSAEIHDVHMHASFPSGHAAAGIYLFLAAGVILRRIGGANGWRVVAWVGRALILIGALIGLTRIALGVHWPSDVLAGWAFGSIALLISALLLWEPLARGWVRPPGRQQPDLERTPS